MTNLQMLKRAFHTNPEKETLLIWADALEDDNQLELAELMRLHSQVLDARLYKSTAITPSLSIYIRKARIYCSKIFKIKANLLHNYIEKRSYEVGTNRIQISLSPFDKRSNAVLTPSLIEELKKDYNQAISYLLSSDEQSWYSSIGND